MARTIGRVYPPKAEQKQPEGLKDKKTVKKAPTKKAKNGEFVKP